MVHMILKRLFFNILIFALIFCMLMLIVFIPRSLETTLGDEETQLKGLQIGDSFVTLDTEKFIKETSGYIKTLSSGSLGETKRHIKVYRYIETSFRRTLTLLSTSFVITILFGLLKGIYDRHKGNTSMSNVKLLSTISFLSIPDIFLILLLQSLAVWLHHKNIEIVTVVAGETIKSMILPVISMTLMPIHYLSRITTVSVERISQLPYITTAIGKGASKSRVLWIHILRNAIVEILGSFSSVVALLISSLLLVEYMFGYPGLTFMMFEYSKEPGIIMATAMILALIYVVVDTFINTIRVLLIPHIKQA